MSTVNELMKEIEERRKVALKAGDIDKVREYNEILALLRYKGGIIKRPNPYLEFMSECISNEVPKNGKHSLGETQEAFKKCVLKWNQMDEKRKEAYRRKGVYEVFNLP